MKDVVKVAREVIGFGWLPFLVAALAATSALAGEQDIEVHFQRRTAVNGERVILGDVATIYAKRLKQFDKISSLVIGQIPAEKSELTVPSEYVRLRIEEALVGSKLSVKVNAPASIEFYKMKIESGSERLSQEILRQAKKLNKVPDGVEVVSEVTTAADLRKINLDDYRLSPAAEQNEWRGHVVFRLTPKAGDALGYWVNARVRWFMNAWVAKNSISYFSEIRADQFEQGRVEVTQMRELPIAAGETAELEHLVKETRAKRSLRPSTPLVASVLDRKPDVKSGQKLKVVFIAESGLRVATDGVIMADGIVGESVKARLKASKKIVAGRLTSPNSLEVSL